ncbi:hypothetical protein H3V53_06120 [Paraburkholderia bengalensis]|uniref:Uncharacterized protein n=1 Tax=Paraburkholderia bengalensis TaxID=2747562 RepID=A0ABU8IMS1_9BURK
MNDTMRICCELAKTYGALTIVDFMQYGRLGEAAVRHAVADCIKAGYMREGKKKQVSVGRGNSRKTFERTRKALPPGDVKLPEIVPAASEFVVHRHWQDVALYGEHRSAA